MMDVADNTLIGIRDMIMRHEVTAREVVSKMLENISKRQNLNAYITVFEGRALKKAAEIDAKISAGENAGELAGVPIAVKDNIAVKGEKTTCASRFLADFVSPENATVVDRLESAGAIIIGKTNMDEFAMGAANKNSAFGKVLNPLDESRIPGGSSGGSAAAVAAKTCYGALGTDTGGSVRQPSSFCGLVGMKPTYSTISRYGVTAFASSLDQVGTMTRTVKDNALLLGILSGADGKDGTAQWGSTKSDVNPLIKGRKIAVVRQMLEAETLSDEMRLAFENAIKTFISAGATVEYRSMPSFNAGIATYFAVSCSEAASTLSRFDGIRYGARAEGGDYREICAKSRQNGFGNEVKKRIMTGNFTLHGENYEKYYVTALKMRSRIKSELEAILADCDFIISPTTPFKVPTLDSVGKTLKQRYYGDMYTVIANLTGNPSLSIPADNALLPAGVLLTGRMRGESELYSAAEAYLSEIGR